MITIFDKKTQIIFCQNFYDAIQIKTKDFTQPNNTYHCKLLTLMEKAHVKQVPLSSDDYVGFVNKNTYRRYWGTDYPLYGYAKRDRRKLVITHLADLDAPQKTFKLLEQEKFIGFVDKCRISRNATFHFLLRIQDVIVLRTCEYNNPYEKKDFTNDAYWS